MRQLSQQVILGAVVIVAVALAYFAYSSIVRLNRPSGYTVLVEFADARGISRGAPVRRAGTDIGWVEKVSLEAVRGLAIAEVKIYPGVTFPKDAIFYIVSEGLIEEKYLAVRNNPNPRPELGNAEDGDVFQGYPDPGLTDLIASANQALVQVNRILDVAASFMSEERLGGMVQSLLEELNTTVGSARVVLERIDSVLGASQGKLSETLSGVASAASNLNEISREVRATVQKTNLSERIDGMLTQVDKTLTLVNQLMSDIAGITSDEAFQEDVKGVFREGRKALEESQKTLQSLQSTLQKVDRRLESFSKFGVEGRLNVRNESTHTNIRSDNSYIDVKARLTAGSRALDIGAENLGKDTPEDAGFTLQAGKFVKDSVLLRGGVFRDELGIGIDILGKGGTSISLDAYNLNNPMLNSYLAFPFSTRFNLLLGVEDVGDRNQYNAGIQVKF